MIFEKPNFSKFIVKFTFKFRTKNLYAFPQGWGWKESLAKIDYDSKKSKESGKSVYKHDNYYVIAKYQISWMFFDMTFELVPEKLSSFHRIEQMYERVAGKEKKPLF